ncbi:MAG: glycosyl transferase family [Geobacteraceae bacterium]|nr:MAG: glycosyl transferase family [Geobacteraceae bacterium]
MNIDVIICTYNRAQKLVRAVESIFASELMPGHNLRLLIVDNNSKDETAQVLKELSLRHGSRLLSIFEERQGKSRALNAALNRISGNLVAFTDDDVTVDRRWIVEMISALERHRECRCFGGRTVPIYPERLPDWLDLDGSMGFVRSVFVDRFDGEEEVFYGKGRTVSQTPAGVNMFFRREAVQLNGLFRTDLGPQGDELGFSEDTEYCQRLIRLGERFMYIPTAVVNHPVHENRLTKEYLLSWQYRCGRSEVRKCGGYNGAPSLLGIPRYLLRKWASHGIGTFLAYTAVERFYNKLKLYFTSGEIIEHLAMLRRRKAAD